MSTTPTDLDPTDLDPTDLDPTDRTGPLGGAGSADVITADVIAADVLTTDVALERRGLWWLLGAFLFCPCHLPLTVGMVTAVLAGTGLGAVLRDHSWIAGTVITLTWLAGTAYGFHLIRQAKRAGGACPTRP